MADHEHSQRPLHQPRPEPAPVAPAPAADPERLAREIIARRRFDPTRGMTAGMLARLDTSGAPGLAAGGIGQRFAARPLRAAPLDLTVSPYAPPLRQLSVVRQGAPMWSPPTAPARPADEPGPDGPEPAAPPPPAQPRDKDELPDDLRRLLDLHRGLNRI